MSASQRPSKKGSAKNLKLRDVQPHPSGEAPSTVRLLSKRQLRDALNLPSTRIVDALMRSRRIPFIKIGHRTLRFDLDRVIEALRRLEVRAIGG